MMCFMTGQPEEEPKEYSRSANREAKTTRIRCPCVANIIEEQVMGAKKDPSVALLLLLVYADGT
jgi:hypothetical protein